MFYVLCFFRQSLGTTLKYSSKGLIKNDQRVTDAVRISTATQGGISFQEAMDMPLYRRQIVIAELHKMNKEMNKK